MRVQVKFKVTKMAAWAHSYKGNLPLNLHCSSEEIKRASPFGYTFSAWKERLDIGCCISSKLTSRPGFWEYAKLVQMQSEKTKGKRSKRQLLLFSRRPSTSVNFVDTPVLLSPCRCSYSSSLDSLYIYSTLTVGCMVYRRFVLRFIFSVSALTCKALFCNHIVLARTSKQILKING